MYWNARCMSITHEILSPLDWVLIQNYIWRIRSSRLKYVLLCSFPEIVQQEVLIISIVVVISENEHGQEDRPRTRVMIPNRVRSLTKPLYYNYSFHPNFVTTFALSRFGLIDVILHSLVANQQSGVCPCQTSTSNFADGTGWLCVDSIMGLTPTLRITTSTFRWTPK